MEVEKRRLFDKETIRVGYEPGTFFFNESAFVGASQAAQNVRAMLERLTQVPFSALVIGGETGTGKGLVTRILHYAGPRAQNPLVETSDVELKPDLGRAGFLG